MGKNKLPTNWKNCATCVHWCGKQTPNPTMLFVEYDTSERAKCAGGGFNGANMGGTATCGKWQQRFKR